MKMGKLIVAWIILLFLALTSSGCSLLNTALSAGLTYAIYQATK